MEKEVFLKQINEEVFNLEDNISFNSNFKEFSSWDSMTTLLLIDFFLTNFDILLDNQSIKGLLTIQDLYNFTNQ
jgi:acyl carrier protein